MTGRPGHRTMERNGGSSASYLAGTPCVPLFCFLLCLLPKGPSRTKNSTESKSLRLLNALNSEGRGLKVRFSLATIVFETFELILCQMLSSQGKNAPSNPYPHHLVRLATSRIHYGDSKIATAIAKHYGECSAMLAFLGKRGIKTVQIVQKTTAVVK